MSSETKNARAEADWRRSLRHAVRDTDELANLLGLPRDTLPGFPDSGPFQLLVPREFVARMRHGDPNDPLLRQILPTSREQESAAGFSSDPLAEHKIAHNGCLQKYPGRALLITTGACPVHCRYCFRRDFPYSKQTAARKQWQPALATLADSANIHELILSGGDPLSLGNRQLSELLQYVETRLPQINTIRIHTRFPVVLPARINAGLIELLAGSPIRIVVVLHTNHPNEIDDEVAHAAMHLRGASSALLNQAVLLRGINDDTATLLALGQRLLDIGVLPYYLHMLDRVSGSAHFEVKEREALAIIESLRKQAPGYLVPKLVRDQSGELSKTPVV